MFHKWNSRFTSRTPQFYIFLLSLSYQLKKEQKRMDKNEFVYLVLCASENTICQIEKLLKDSQQLSESLE